MVPTPRNLGVLGEAGLHSEELSRRGRGRRYFHVEDSVKEKESSLTPRDLGAMTLEDHVPTPYCKPTEKRTKDDFCGLSSMELSNINMHNNRGRRRLKPDWANKSNRAPDEASLASDPISEASACNHLGPRTKADKAEDCRSKGTPRQSISGSDMENQEPVGGMSSHQLSLRTSRLGMGKKHFRSDECPWVGIQKSMGLYGDKAATDASDGFHFLGAKKKSITHGQRKDANDNLFDDTILESEWRSRKHFAQEWDQVFHGSEDCPLGVNGTQTDLHTKGFLGKSKRRFDASPVTARKSQDVITHNCDAEHDPHDIASYGLGHRGKRKFLVQHNLEPGCRHNLSRPEGVLQSAVRSASVPVLEIERPPNTTPFWQDDLAEEERATKNEQQNFCISGREQDRHLNGKQRTRHIVQDNTWSCMTWTPRKVDEATATRFIEGQDDIHAVTAQEHREVEFRTAMGKTKRSYGNAHNKSDFRFDYCDDPASKSEHYSIVKVNIDETDVKQSVIDSLKQKDSHERHLPNERPLHWGVGHGRRKFNTVDHLGNANPDSTSEGVECFLSAAGAKLGAVKHKRVEDHLNPGDPSYPSTDPVFFLGTDGKTIRTKTRHHAQVRDTVDELMDCEVQSENSNSMAVAGMRRRTEIIRPHSARRFPEKDFERATARSVSPRAASATVSPRTPLRERPRWK